MGRESPTEASNNDTMTSTDSTHPLQDEPISSDELGNADNGDYEDPADEPAPELLLGSEEKRLAEMDGEVFVVDGRPRFHIPECDHLADKASQGLPVSEAVELGFTPCSLCAAATTLLTL